MSTAETKIWRKKMLNALKPNIPENNFYMHVAKAFKAK
jgi:hypothetical protein